jgi:hypothetical protein
MPRMAALVSEQRPLFLMSCTSAKMRLSAPVLTGTTPAGKAGATKTGSTIRAVPSPFWASAKAAVPVCDQLRVAGSQNWRRYTSQPQSATADLT